MPFVSARLSPMAPAFSDDVNPFISPIEAAVPVPIMLRITSPRFDSESMRNCADVTTRWPALMPEMISM